MIMGQQIDPSQPHGPTHQAATSRPEPPTPARWHKTARLPDGTVLGRLGAYWYILDDDGRAISDGYHEIYLDETGEYKGKRSARSEPVTLHTEPDQ